MRDLGSERVKCVTGKLDRQHTYLFLRRSLLVGLADDKLRTINTIRNENRYAITGTEGTEAPVGRKMWDLMIRLTQTQEAI